ncbi:MAG: polysaccharide deacetylase family protein [Nitrospirae bacterium]|nr:polysaccharide deacetylase family protein [Nitrospirota bacterium]
MFKRSIGKACSEGLFYLSLILLMLVLFAGCASTRKTPSTFTAPQIHLQPEERSYARVFPDFIAVIAQPGDTFASLAGKYLNDPSLDWFIAGFNDVTTLGPGQELIVPLYDYRKGGLSVKGHQTVPVLSYHKFSKYRSDTLTVSERDFEEQMAFLKKNGYKVISADELFDFLNFRKQVPDKSVVITIDDGWRSTYDIAFPILKKYGYPATLFVYTDFITQGSNALDWKLVSAMEGNGIDIQCHTKTHRNLNMRDEQESFREYFESLKEELTESAAIIRKRLNKEVRYLAYPYGETNSLTVALLKKLGYRGAFTVYRGGNPFFIDNYRIKRSMVYGSFSLKEFERNLITFSNNDLN